MTRRDFLKMSALTLIAATAPLDAAAHGPRPNIVLINCDDLGYGDLGCYGSTTIATPNIDGLARRGIRFTDFYCGAPVCTPSRACLMTGRYAFRSGLSKGLFPNDGRGLPDSEVTMARELKRVGYSTACIGKWHLGVLPQFLPTRRGFDYYYGIPYSNDTDRKNLGEPPTPLMRGEKIIEQPVDQDTLTARYTKEATQFIERQGKKPFFLYLAHSMPHVPLHCSPQFRGKSKASLYGDVVQELDWSVGKVVQTLRNRGLERNTVVIFTSDNGPWLLQKENGGSAGPLRGGKNGVFEGGMREPFIVSRPGTITPGVICRQQASQLDLFPTLVAMAGGRVPQDRVIDGRDIRPMLAGKKMEERPFYYCHNDVVHAVRLGKWKLHVARVMRKLPEPELYNLDLDIGERVNLAKQQPEIVRKLTGLVEGLQKHVPVIR